MNIYIYNSFDMYFSFYSILSYLGEVGKNHDILREAYSLCHSLPVLNSKRFQEDYYTVIVFCFFSLLLLLLGQSERVSWVSIPMIATYIVNINQPILSVYL